MDARVTAWLLTICLLSAGEATAQVAAPKSGQLPPPFVTKQTDLEIPFTVNMAKSADAQPATVRVFVSWDRGETWHFLEEKRVEDGRFRFRPKQDGEYWFSTQTVDRLGRTDNAQQRRPQLRVVVDTQKPQLLAQPSASGGQVTLGLNAADATLNPGTLKVEYQDVAGGAWEPVVIDPAAINVSGGQLTVRTAFAPHAAGRAINVRAEVADMAGNMAYFSQQMSLTPSNPRPRGEYAVAPRPDPSATKWLPGTEAPGAAHEQVAQGPATTDRSNVPDFSENPFSRRDSFASSSYKSASGNSDRPPESSATAETLPPPQESHNLSPTIQPAMPQEEIFDQGPLEGEQLASPEGQRPRLTSSRRFSLEYDVESVGPEGIAEVELWGTSDGGRTWVKWGSDPDRQSPLDVEVSGEATYGFRIVIVGKSGLASNAPRDGDAADIWIGIDTTRPQARLLSAAYGQGEAAGKLDIRWEASDANLSERPVTLLMGDSPDGTFSPIASGLPNSGQYYWQFDPRSPRLIYLRLEARDDAGNVTIDQLQEPIKVEGLQPKGRIRGFATGAGDLPRDAQRPSQTR